MSSPAPAPAAPAPAPAAPPKKSWFKAILFGFVGIGSGVLATYTTSIINTVAKPTKPVANFAVAADGLAVTCQNHATGESGWWDFGDGSPLEPFAPEKPAAHTYARPGSYTVKLTVRNFLADENERSVPVEVSVAAKDATPQIAAFALQPVSPVSFAPATYRLLADVVHADACVWDLGDGRVEVTGGGKIDRLVTFEKPGTFPVSLVAHNGKQAAKQAGSVKVEAPREGTTMAVLRVTDTGSRVERITTTESPAIPVPKEKGATTFSKSVAARPGYSIAEAALAEAPGHGVKNVKVQVAADKRSATVSGEWAGDLKATNKAAGGSDVIVRVKLTQQRVTPMPPAVTMVTGTFTASGSGIRADLTLPPAPVGMAGAKREFQLDIRTVRDGKTQTVMQAPQGGKGAMSFPWSVAQQGPGWTVTYTAKVEGETVVVTAAQASK